MKQKLFRSSPSAPPSVVRDLRLRVQQQRRAIRELIALVERQAENTQMMTIVVDEAVLQRKPLTDEDRDALVTQIPAMRLAIRQHLDDVAKLRTTFDAQERS